MSAAFSEQETIRQSQQGRPVTALPATFPGIPSVSWLSCGGHQHSVAAATPGFGEKLRTGIWARLGKGLASSLSAKRLCYLPASQSRREGSPDWSERRSPAVIKSRLNCSCLKHLQMEMGRTWSSAMQVETC